MIPLVGSLTMGIFSVLIYWATISLGGARARKAENGGWGSHPAVEVTRARAARPTAMPRPGRDCAEMVLASVRPCGRVLDCRPTSGAVR